MINILIDKSGKTSKENIFLGNQHENLDETLHFSFPKEYDNFYKYITYSYSNNNQRVTGISPLVDDNFIITSKITKCAGVWELNLICKISPVNLDDKVIDLTENNSTKEHIFISNTISACVSGNSVDVESFNNVAVDENIASLYDSVLALKNKVEENDKAHEENEAVRKANELERQEAENTRQLNENTRISAEQSRIEAENTRKSNETVRQSKESARTEAETNRDSAEVKRASAENKRVETETARQSAEAVRVSEENKRISAEANRANTEKERVSAETSRKQAESARVSAETARTQTEANRVENEKLRVSAERAREQTEQSRVNAESQRSINEATRESAERARIEAETARVTAENERVNAETLRVKAENERKGTLNNLKEQVDSKITKFYTSNQGETHITDSDNGKIQDMMIYGKLAQDGTPTLENPIEVKSIVNPTIKIRGANLLKLEFKRYNNNGITLEIVGNKIRLFGTFTDTYACFAVKNKPLIKKGTKLLLYVDNYNNHGAFVWLELLSNGNIDKLNKTQPSNTLTSDEYLNSIGVENYTVGDTIDFTTTFAVLDSTDIYEPYTEQTFTLPYTLNAIPVSSDGNITIDGQQYIADYIDVEKGKLYRKVRRLDLKNVENSKFDFNVHTNGNGYLAISLLQDGLFYAIKDIPPKSNNFIGSLWTNKSGYVYIPIEKNVIFVNEKFTNLQTAIELTKDTYVIYALQKQIIEDLTSEQIQALKKLVIYYPTANISIDSEQIEGYTVFNYPISLANGWNYVKKQLNDNRDYIYDIDMQSAEAYVNSEYVTVLTELEV